MQSQCRVQKKTSKSTTKRRNSSPIRTIGQAQAITEFVEEVYGLKKEEALNEIPLLYLLYRLDERTFDAAEAANSMQSIKPSGGNRRKSMTRTSR